MTLNIDEFRGNRYSENRTVLRGVNDIWPLFCTFFVLYEEKFGTGNVREHLLTDCESRENRHTEYRTSGRK
jgi:hypothetical protein